MSERMTNIRLLPSKDSGWAEWGRKTVPEMIEEYRRHARYMKECAEAVLAAKDEDFYVSTYLGVHVQRNREVLQQGLPKPPPPQAAKQAWEESVK